MSLEEIREILALSPIFNNWLSEKDRELLIEEYRENYESSEN